MAMKLVIGTKSGKCYQKELSTQEAEALYGKALGETINGELIGISGVELELRGGSDIDGFPMRKDVHGQNRKKVLLTKGVGFSGKLRGKRFGGLRVKKMVCGNTVHNKIHQVNVKVVKGEQAIEAAFAPAPAEEAKEE
ncbi:MAG: 30S ribosomal protein S6e [Nanoarchaeota archaeon]|nr:30S ribosomal protein S6e [Nanoarchaeota archaeon]